jgi:hypothetical protein
VLILVAAGRTFFHRVKASMEHRIEIAWARRWNCSSWVGHGSYNADYQGERIGEWRVVECDAARWLKANAGGVDSDTLVTMRNGVPAMRGSIGWLAARTIEETDRISPRWIKWRPFVLNPKDAAETVRSAGVLLASTPSPASSSPSPPSAPLFA